MLLEVCSVFSWLRPLATGRADVAAGVSNENYSTVVPHSMNRIGVIV